MNESATAFCERIDLTNRSVADQIRMLAWFCHKQGADRLATSDLSAIYREMHLKVPNVSTYLAQLSVGKGASFLKDKKGYRLEGKLRRELDSKLSPAIDDALLQIKGVLSGLIPLITDASERTFLEEALRCYSVSAFRAAVIMTWNLAYSHILNWVLEPTRLAAFNNSVALRYPKHASRVTDIDSFQEFKEFEVIEIFYTANLIDKNRTEILRAKLKRRNACAHPSTIVVSQPQVDDVITDLVHNIILKMV